MLFSIWPNDHQRGSLKRIYQMRGNMRRPIITSYSLLPSLYSRHRLSSGYRTWHLTRGLQVHTRPNTMDFQGNKNPSSHNFHHRRINPSAPRRKLLQHFIQPCGVWKRYYVDKIHGHFRQVSSVSLPGVSARYCQKAVVDKSGVIRTQTGNAQQISNGRSVWDTLCDTTQ
jgi:hypothetical protein